MRQSEFHKLAEIERNFCKILQLTTTTDTLAILTELEIESLRQRNAELEKLMNERDKEMSAIKCRIRELSGHTDLADTERICDVLFQDSNEEASLSEKAIERAKTLLARLVEKDEGLGSRVREIRAKIRSLWSVAQNYCLSMILDHIRIHNI